MDTIATIAGILVLAALAEGLVEYIVGPIVEAIEAKRPATRPEPSPAWPRLVLRYSAVVTGILLCVAYRADILTFFGLVPPWPWVGYIITGVIVGRGSNYVHDFASTWLRSD